MARTTRAGAERERNEKVEVYIPPNDTELDPYLVDYYKEEGMVLRWIRFKIEGRPDTENLINKQREGWQLVTADELPEGFTNMFEIGHDGRVEGVIVQGDLALGKIPVGKARARKEYYENKAIETERAINLQLQRTSSREMPIINESKSKATTGRKPAEFGATAEDD